MKISLVLLPFEHFKIFTRHIYLLEQIHDSRFWSRILIVVTGLNWTILNFVWPTPGLIKFGNGSNFPDMLPGYNSETIQKILSQYGPTGRIFYEKFLLSGDIIFPILYSLFFGLLVWRLIRNTKLEAGTKWMLVSISFFAGLFDYTENIFMLWNIESFPNISPLSVQLGSLATLAKHGLSFLGIMVLVIMSGYHLRNKFWSK